MGRKKDKRRKLEENRFSSFQSSSDEEENSDAISQKTIKFQVSLKPHGSKIKKPTNFFQGALAEVVKRERICDKFAVKNVTFLKDDMFMVETKGENGQAIVKLMEAGELEYASKSIKVLSISEGTISQDPDKNVEAAIKEGDSSFPATSADSSDPKIEGAIGPDPGSRPGSQSNITDDEASDIKLLVSGLPEKFDDDYLVLYFENRRNCGTGCAVTSVEHIGQGAVMMAFETPSVIRNIVGRKHQIKNYDITVQIFDERAARDPRKIRVHGITQDIDQELLTYYFENPRQGGGEIENLQKLSSSAVITFAKEDDAQNVLKTKTYNLKGMSLVVEEYKEDPLSFITPIEENNSAILEEKSSLSSDYVVVEQRHAGTITSNDEKDIRDGQDVDREDIQEWKRILIASADSDEVDEESLQIFFESEEVGGGEIVSIESRGDSYKMIFADIEVAQRLLATREFDVFDHRVSLKQFECTRDTQIHGEMHEELHADAERSVEVHGDVGKLDKKFFTMYLENEKRSGGGNIEKIEFDTKPVVVTFHEIEAARRILEKGKLTLKNQELIFKPVKKDAAKDIKEKAPRATAPSVDMRQVEIHGDIAKIGKDRLLMYLESETRSGGGKLISKNLQANPPTVTFFDEKVADRIISKASHSLNKISFLTKRPTPKKPEIYKKGVAVIDNLSPKTSKDSIEMYIDRIFGCEADSIEYNYNKTAVMLSLSGEIDWEGVRERHSKKSSLDDNMLKIIRVPECDRVIVSNIAKETTEDGLSLKLGKIVSDECIGGVSYNRKKEFAVIKIVHPEAVKKLKSREIILDGKTLVIEEHNKCFITDRTWKMLKKESHEVSMEVDSDIFKFILHNHKKQLTDILKTDVHIKNKTSEDGNTACFACFTPIDNMPEPQTTFREFYNQFTSQNVIVYEDSNFEQEVKKVMQKHRLDVTILKSTSGASGSRVVIGRVADVRQLKLFIDKLTEEAAVVECKVPIDSDKLNVLLASGYLRDLEQEMKVKIAPKQDGINISGPEKRVATVKEAVVFQLVSVKERYEKLSKSICASLKQKKGYQSAMELVKRHGLKITFNVDSARDEINFTGLTDKDLRKGIEVFMKNVVDIEIPTGKEDSSLLSAQKGSEMLLGLREKNSISIDVKGSKILLSGVKEICNRVQREVEDFLQENAFHKRVIKLTFGKTKAVLTLARDKVRDLEREFKHSDVSVKKTQDQCGIEVSGHGGSVEEVLRVMKQISGGIISEEKILQRPGVTKIIESTSFENAKSGLESEKKVVIINKAEDKECSAVNDEVKQSYVILPSQTSKLICKFKTNGGQILAVYHGDITNHQADIVVNPANENLWLGGGVAGAISSAGGTRIQDECDEFIREWGKVEIGGVAMTTAGNMNLKGIIHAVGPHWPQNVKFMGQRELQQNQKECKALLGETMTNVLLQAENAGCAVLAVPAISSGIFGFPKDLCAEILTDVTLRDINDESLSNLKEIHFINNDVATVEVFAAYFKRKFGQLAGYQKVNNVDSTAATSTSDVRYRRDYAMKKPATQPRQQQQQRHQQQQQRERQQQELSNRPVGGSQIIQAEGGISIELVVGDLAKQKVDVIVNSVSTDLDLSKNPCALGLSKAAGPELQKLCREWIQTNGNLTQYDFAVTESGKLQCERVFHAACGDYNGATTEKQLEDLCTNMLQEASKLNAKEIAIPALGTGTLNFPRDKVAQIMVSCATEFSKKHGKSTSVKKVCLVAYHLDQLTIDAFKGVLGQPASSGAPPQHERVRRAASQQLPQSRFDLDSGAFKLGDVSVEVLKGDITEEKTDAIAVFGNANLNLGGAVGQAICRKEGRQIEAEAKRKAPQKAGSTVLLKTRELPSKYIAHIYPQSESYDGLKEATRSMFEKCDKKPLTSVSIPAIGTGLMGKSAKTSAQLILHSFAELCVKGSLRNIKTVRIIIFEGKMVDDFKAELANVLRNPEEILKTAEGGVVDWIKEKFAFVASLFSSKPTGAGSSGIASIVTGGSKEDFKPVILVIYGLEQKAIRESTKKLVDIVEENIHQLGAKREDYKQLSKQQIEQIKAYAMKRDVLFEIDKKSGTVRSIGYFKDAGNIMNELNDLIADQLKEKQEREKQQLVAGLVQWKEVQKGNAIINYDPILNCKLETLYQDKCNGATIDMEDDNGVSCTFEIDFDKMTCVNLKNKEKREIIREELGESKSPLPQEWDKMPTNQNGHEAKVHVVTLQPTSAEFIKIQALYLASSKGLIPQVLEIRRIQNPQLYKSFMAKKESMEKTAGAGSDNEKRLFHGTSASSVDEINESGFNRSFAGVNGTAYGNGVYFARDSSYSAGYAKHGPGGRYMYLARVLVGKHTTGQNGMKVPPKGFDTVANNTSQNPDILVVFYDNQCYPEYLLRFQ